MASTRLPARTPLIMLNPSLLVTTAASVYL